MSDSKKPSHRAYSIREYEKDGKKDSFWTQIGVAFKHKDGNGFDVLLESIPLNGRITIREPKADDGKAKTAE